MSKYKIAQGNIINYVITETDQVDEVNYLTDPQGTTITDPQGSGIIMPG